MSPSQSSVPRYDSCPSTSTDPLGSYEHIKSHPGQRGDGGAVLQSGRECSASESRLERRPGIAFESRLPRLRFGHLGYPRAKDIPMLGGHAKSR